MRQTKDDNALLNQAWDVQRDLLLRLLPPTATLAGLCLAGVSLFSIHPRLNRADTVVDDMLAVNALLFLISIFLTMWSVRCKKTSTALRMARWIDWLFLLAVTLLVVAGSLMVFIVL